MFNEMNEQEIMMVNGVGVTIGSLLIAMGLGGAAGGVSGAVLGSAVCPGAGTVGGALSGVVWGAGNAALAHLLQSYAADGIDNYL